MNATVSVQVQAAAGSATRSFLWNPYAVGAGLGVLSWVVFAVVNQPLGISTSLSAASGACAAPLLGAEAVQSNAYWAKHAFKWDYGMFFLVGTFLGSLISSFASRSLRVETVPSVWSEYFGASAVKRFIAAFIGGVLVLFGARMEGGCTSGHGISGSLQLAVSSWLFFLMMFASGIATAAILFRKRAHTTL